MFVFDKMTPELQAYLNHKIKDFPDDYEGFTTKKNQLKALVSKELIDEYYQAEKIWICRDDNVDPKTRIEKSPSGKYELHISNHETGTGTWGYSKGKIFEGTKLIAEICRNYGAFPFLFIENHPKGDFIVAGEDYQGQTVVDLKSGQRIDFLPPEAEEGNGFCWGGYKYDEASQILVVDGCFWACPYEFRFYDFSDPMNGWPEIKITDGYVDADKKWPIIGSDGITIFQTEYDDSDDEEEKEMSIKTFKRNGLKLELTNEWISDKEQADRIKREETNHKHEEWLENFKQTNPLWLKMNELLNSSFSPQDGFGIGVTHENWCPDFKEQEKRICKRIVQRKNGSKWTVDLEWAHELGPIKLIIYKDGDNFETKFFEHSVEQMTEAFNYVKSICL